MLLTLTYRHKCLPRRIFKIYLDELVFSLKKKIAFCFQWWRRTVWCILGYWCQHWIVWGRWSLWCLWLFSENAITKERPRGDACKCTSTHGVLICPFPAHHVKMLKCMLSTRKMQKNFVIGVAPDPSVQLSLASQATRYGTVCVKRYF